MAAALLAGGGHRGRAARLPPGGARAGRGPRALPRPPGPGGAHRPKLLPPRLVPGIRRRRGARHSLPLPRMALRRRGQLSGAAVRAPGERLLHQGEASGLSGEDARRIALRLHGPRPRRSAAPAQLLPAGGPRRPAAGGGHPPLRLQLVQLLREQRRSLPRVDSPQPERLRRADLGRGLLQHQEPAVLQAGGDLLRHEDRHVQARTGKAPSSSTR